MEFEDLYQNILMYNFYLLVQIDLAIYDEEENEKQRQDESGKAD